MKIQLFARIILIFFCLSMMIASAKANLTDGIYSYNKRHEGSIGTKASTKNIDIAINFFENKLKDERFEEQTALFLLKCYYYKAEFALTDIEQKKIIFNKGKSIGEQFINKYPESVEFRYWYLVNLGSWAKVYGIITAAREGVADQMKNHSEKIIELDPNYQNGGGYFMLGAIHYKSPYIPFLLSWPDNDEAIKFLQKSINTGKATLNQMNYFAQALYKDGQTEKAKKLLKEVVNTKPSSDNLVEDLDDIKEAQQLLNDLF